MSVFEVRSTLNVNSLRKRRRSDLEFMLSQLMSDLRLCNEDLASAIVHLSNRLPEDTNGV